MRLFIAEKKVLGEAIAEALDGKVTIKDSVIYKGNNAVVWCSGHLLTLREPESYNEKYKVWNMADLPIYFDAWENASETDWRIDKTVRRSSKLRRYR